MRWWWWWWYFTSSNPTHDTNVKKGNKRKEEEEDLMIRDALDQNISMSKAIHDSKEYILFTSKVYKDKPHQVGWPPSTQDSSGN